MTTSATGGANYATALTLPAAGIPVTFHADVHGVNAFCASKSAAGSASLRIAPTGSGGAARVAPTGSAA